MAIASPTQFLTLTEASRRYGIARTHLQRLIDAGTIRVAVVRGEYIVSEEEISSHAAHKEDLPEYRQFSHLSGVGIWISEASRKYNISTQTVSRWKDKGYIKTVGMDGNKILLDEQDVAYCVLIFNRNRGQGKRIFSEKGTPYSAKRK